jgi:hypothetical protein
MRPGPARRGIIPPPVGQRMPCTLRDQFEIAMQRAIAAFHRGAVGKRRIDRPPQVFAQQRLAQFAIRLNCHISKFKARCNKRYYPIGCYLVSAP